MSIEFGKLYKSLYNATDGDQIFEQGSYQCWYLVKIHSYLLGKKFNKLILMYLA